MMRLIASCIRYTLGLEKKTCKLELWPPDGVRIIQPDPAGSAKTKIRKDLGQSWERAAQHRGRLFSPCSESKELILQGIDWV